MGRPNAARPHLLHIRLRAILTITPMPLFGRLFVITLSLDVFDETFLLADLLKTLHHLLNGLTASGPNLDHKTTPTFRQRAS